MEKNIRWTEEGNLGVIDSIRFLSNRSWRRLWRERIEADGLEIVSRDLVARTIYALLCRLLWIVVEQCRREAVISRVSRYFSILSRAKVAF